MSRSNSHSNNWFAAPPAGLISYKFLQIPLKLIKSIVIIRVLNGEASLTKIYRKEYVDFTLSYLDLSPPATGSTNCLSVSYPDAREPPSEPPAHLRTDVLALP